MVAVHPWNVGHLLSKQVRVLAIRVLAFFLEFCRHDSCVDAYIECSISEYNAIK